MCHHSVLLTSISTLKQFWGKWAAREVFICAPGRCFEKKQYKRESKAEGLPKEVPVVWNTAQTGPHV